MVKVEMGPVREGKRLVEQGIMRAERGGLPVEHEFTEQMRHDAHAGGKSPIQAGIEGQIVHVRRIDDDAATKARPGERLDLESVLRVCAGDYGRHQEYKQDHLAREHRLPSFGPGLGRYAAFRGRRGAPRRAAGRQAAPYREEPSRSLTIRRGRAAPGYRSPEADLKVAATNLGRSISPHAVGPF